MVASDEVRHPTRSFVLRIWIEEPATGGGRARWRGHITHVQSGERRSIDSFAGILRYLVAHLAAVGVRPGLRDRIRMAVMRADRR
jgi:hypothetical protein